MRNFRELKVWEKSHKLALQVYRSTKPFPRDEQYGVTSQIRRAAFSIPTNIAEGCGRDGDKDFGRFLVIAMGSAAELEYLLLLSRDLGYIADGDYASLSDEATQIKRMLTGFIVRLKTNR